MSPALVGFLWAIVSALCLGTGTFLYKISSRSLGASNTTFFYYLFSIVIATAIWICTPGKEAVEKHTLVWPALMALFLCASVWTFSSAVRTIDMSVASTVRGLSFIPAVILALVLYGEKLTPKSIAAIVLVLCAILLLGFDTVKKSP
jgi:multidrug transporter EmrE-like cation transporter